jgi:hypothetical protein
LPQTDGGESNQIRGGYHEQWRRTDLIEVDLKRPGRVDVKIPIFPTTTPEEGFALLRALCGRRGVTIAESELPSLRLQIPNLLTPGAAEALAVKIYRLVRTQNKAAIDAMRDCLEDYQNPVAADVMDFQIRIAVQEASDLEFVPACFRPRPIATQPAIHTATNV